MQADQFLRSHPLEKTSATELVKRLAVLLALHPVDDGVAVRSLVSSKCAKRFTWVKERRMSQAACKNGSRPSLASSCSCSRLAREQVVFRPRSGAAVCELFYQQMLGTCKTASSTRGYRPLARLFCKMVVKFAFYQRVLDRLAFDCASPQNRSR